MPDASRLGWIYGEAIRICRNSTLEVDYDAAIKRFIENLKKREYPDDITVKYTASVRHCDRKTILANVIRNDKPKRVYFSNSKLRPCLVRHFNKFLRNYEDLSGVRLERTQKVVFRGIALSHNVRAINRRILGYLNRSQASEITPSLNGVGR
jgi:hypothetical protein